jgi:hypothetical protein
MVEKLRRRHKRRSRSDSGASNRKMDSASRKKSGIRPARPNSQPNPSCALRAIALVSSLIAIDVHARVNVTTNKVDAHESPAAELRFVTYFVAARDIARQI